MKLILLALVCLLSSSCTVALRDARLDGEKVQAVLEVQAKNDENLSKAFISFSEAFNALVGRVEALEKKQK